MCITRDNIHNSKPIVQQRDAIEYHRQDVCGVLAGALKRGVR